MKCLWFPHLHKNAVNHFSLDFLRTVSYKQLWSCFLIAFFIFWMMCTQLKWFLILQKRINLIMKFWDLSLLTVHVNSYYVSFFLDPSLTPFDITICSSFKGAFQSLKKLSIDFFSSTYMINDFLWISKTSWRMYNYFYIDVYV